jgi:hypothetical protein
MNEDELTEILEGGPSFASFGFLKEGKLSKEQIEDNFQRQQDEGEAVQSIFPNMNVRVTPACNLKQRDEGEAVQSIFLNMNVRVTPACELQLI